MTTTKQHLVFDGSADETVTIAAGEHCHVACLNTGSSQKLTINLAGEGASVSVVVLGLLVDAAGELSVDIQHTAPRTTSSQLVRVVAGEKGKLDARMHAAVPPATPGCDIRQDNKNLLLAHTADVRVDPTLNIQTDEVAASHGSATGALSETALWYLASRGVPTDVAQGLLTTAFITPALEELPEELQELARQKLTAMPS